VLDKPDFLSPSRVIPSPLPSGDERIGRRPLAVKSNQREIQIHERPQVYRAAHAQAHAWDRAELLPNVAQCSARSTPRGGPAHGAEQNRPPADPRVPIGPPEGRRNARWSRSSSVVPAADHGLAPAVRAGSLTPWSNHTNCGTCFRGRGLLRKTARAPRSRVTISQASSAVARWRGRNRQTLQS
jgi:hypothetical protein